MTRQHSSDSVELNVTAMLDMAFQLLAFFVLTFRPDPTESGVLLHLPSTQPVTIAKSAEPGEKPTTWSFQSADFNTLRISLFSTSGSIDRMSINSIPLDTFEVMRDTMRSMLTDPNSSIEQVVVQSSEDLHYSEVMKVIGICLEQKLSRTGEFVKLRLVAMGDSR